MASVTDTKVVLLVEDNIDDEHLTLRSLRRNNIMNEVVVAVDGHAAVQKIEEIEHGDAMPSLVILDLSLPGMGGLDVLKRIRANAASASVPVVVVTANDDPTAVNECYRNGANSYVKKPDDPTEYSDVILQIAMYWLLLNRTASTRRGL